MSSPRPDIQQIAKLEPESMSSGFKMKYVLSTTLLDRERLHISNILKREYASTTWKGGR